jgi:diguanylate cyclase (GGDEF)-like protein
MDLRLDPPSALPICSADDAGVRVRIDALNDEAWSIRFRQPERSEALAGEALALAEASGYPLGVVLGLRTLGAQQTCLHSNYGGAERLLCRALDLLDAEGEPRGRADLLNCFGSLHRRRGEYPEAMRLHLAALELQRAAGDRAGEAWSLGLVGMVHHLLGDYGRALECQQASLALGEERGDAAEVALALVNVGAIHGMMGEPERVIEFMLRALPLHEQGNPRLAAVCMVNLGNAYAEMGEDGRALEFLEGAAGRLDLADQASCACDIGRIHERAGDDPRALACYVHSRELIAQVGDRIYEPETLMRLGALRVRMGEVEAGLADLHHALGSAEAQGARQHVYAVHEALAEAYETTGDTARALEHHRAFHAVWREVFSTETNLRIQNARVRSEVQQTQREAEILREKNEALTRADEEKARLLDQLREQAAELERQTREDALTGVSNRRHLDVLLQAEWERALRFGRAMTVAMVDIDHFKQINDRFSHAVGDEVLRTVARILRENTRGVDAVARYGGEEFCLVLVETGLDAGAHLCERLRSLVASYDWSAVRPNLAVTISIGVAAMAADTEAPDALLAAADVRLYAAKHAGRNRVRA